MKKVFYVLQFCILVLCGCGSDSEEDEELSGGKGLAPNEIVGKTLTLKKVVEVLILSPSICRNRVSWLQVVIWWIMASIHLPILIPLREIRKRRTI